MKFICQIGIVLILYSVKNQRMEMCSGIKRVIPYKLQYVASVGSG